MSVTSVNALYPGPQIGGSPPPTSSSSSSEASSPFPAPTLTIESFSFLPPAVSTVSQGLTTIWGPTITIAVTNPTTTGTASSSTTSFSTTSSSTDANMTSPTTEFSSSEPTLVVSTARALDMRVVMPAAASGAFVLLAACVALWYFKKRRSGYARVQVLPTPFSILPNYQSPPENDANDCEAGPLAETVPDPEERRERRLPHRLRLPLGRYTVVEGSSNPRTPAPPYSTFDLIRGATLMGTGIGLSTIGGSVVMAPGSGDLSSGYASARWVGGVDEHSSFRL